MLIFALFMAFSMVGFTIFAIFNETKRVTKGRVTVNRLL